MLAVLILTLLGLQFVTYSDQAISVSIPRFGFGSSNFNTEGGCPGNYQQGDVIYLQGCRAIQCYSGYTSTVSCSTSEVEYDRTSCYLRYNTELNYPYCCRPNVVCVGDEGFDETQLAGNTDDGSLSGYQK